MNIMVNINFRKCVKGDKYRLRESHFSPACPWYSIVSFVKPKKQMFPYTKL